MTPAAVRPPSTFYTLRRSPPSPPDSSGRKTSGTKEGSHGGFPRGLCTPPTDGIMGTTYEVPPHLQLCENYSLHHPSAYPSSNPHPDRRRPALNERPVPNAHLFNSVSRCSAQAQTQTQTRSATTITTYRPTPPESTIAAAAPAMACSTAAPGYPRQHDTGRRPKHPTPTSSKSPAEGAANAKMTHHSMTIPERISARGGSIADFMAEVAALFWFESTKLLDQAKKTQKPGPGVRVPPLAASAVASQHFKKWVSTVLTTTQVTQNVVLLALLYIYRLKKANPTVKGRPGSEYRLLTVALMLGNKFLDDNTYTNKTWADVSGISVNEIHVMEVEFLSNMRYSLLVSADEWEQWLGQLTKFWAYLELAQRPASPSPSPITIPSPTHRDGVISPLHSPTVPLSSGLQSTTHSFTLQSPNLAPLTSGQAWPASYISSNVTSPLASKHEARPCRKRNHHEESLVEYPAKRPSRAPAAPVTLPSQAPVQFAPAASQPQTHYSLGHPTPVASVQPRPEPSLEQGRPQVPSLTLNTTQAADVRATHAPSYAAPAYGPPQAALSLPPLASGVRAMSMVFTTTYAPSQSVPATCGVATPTSSFPAMTYGTPTKRLSPQNALAAYPNSSPLVMGTPMANGSASGLHTPISHSPSIYLQQRNSPYKPVRHVNTLLYPPPSAFLQQYNLPNPVLPNQMHYQPLGKRNEYRTGVVPDFVNNVHRSAPYQHQAVPQVLPNPHPHAHTRGHYQLPAAARPGAYPEQY